MARFATSEWIAELRTHAATLAVEPDIQLVIEQRLVGPDPTSWSVSIRDGSVTIDAGPHPAPDVTLTCDTVTATAIHAGETSAPRAFLHGTLQIGGDLTLLIQNRPALTVISELLAAT